MGTAEMEREIRYLRRAVDALLQGVMLVETFAPPAKPTDATMLLADGTHWNPGSGRGVYRYNSATASWIFLG